MADHDKTEKATPKRRQEARKKGQVVKSTDVNTAVVMAASIGAIAALGPNMMATLAHVMARGMQQTANPELASQQGLGTLCNWALMSFINACAPLIAAIGAAGLAANVFQVKLKISPEGLKPQFKKLNPGPGFKRILGKQGLFDALKALIKTSVVGAVAYMSLAPKMPEFGAMIGMAPSRVLGTTGGLAMSVAIRVIGVFAVIAAADYLWQRRQHENKMKMTKEEVKQEHKQQEGSPEVKRAVRRRQMEMARRRMMTAVPTADVVIVNPTHFAVALRYDGSKPAPEVVAKGVDLVALAIRRLAEENGVPVIENKPLARGLYRDVEIGWQIPEEFFLAVAEVLAFVFRTARGRSRHQALSPAGR